MNHENHPLDRLWIIADHILWSAYHSYNAPTAQRKHPATSARSPAQSWMRINHSGEVCAQALFLGAMCFAQDDDNFEQFASLMRHEFNHLMWCKKRLMELDCAPSASDPLWALSCFIMALVAGARGDNIAWSFIEETEILVIRHLRESFRELMILDPISAEIVKQMIQDETQHALTAHQGMEKLQRTGFLPYMRPLFSILKEVVK